DPDFPNDASKCYDILLNPQTSPNCTEDTLADPAVCKRCVKIGDCGMPGCSISDPNGPNRCVLCPGQDPSTLPADCNGTTTCPTGTTSCAGGAACPANSYCSNDCCIGIIL